jgi:hypothetical protein
LRRVIKGLLRSYRFRVVEAEEVDAGLVVAEEKQEKRCAERGRPRTVPGWS